MTAKASRIYIASVGILLIVVSLAKLWSAFGNAMILATGDPVFGIPFRVLMTVTSGVELVIGSICLLRPSRISSATLVAWFSTTILVYRLGMFAAGWRKPCPCLGNITGALHMSSSTAETVTKVLLGYFLVGSIAIIAIHWRQGRLEPLRSQMSGEPT